MSNKSKLHVDPVNLKQEAAEIIKLVTPDSKALREFEQKFAQNCSDMLIHAWRADRRMRDRGSTEIKDEHRMIHRSIAGILDSLEALGFHLKDREGEPYDYGLPEKVVAAEKRSGLSRELVAETIRPSLFYHDQLLREGEIVIAVPDDSVQDKT